MGEHCADFRAVARWLHLYDAEVELIDCVAQG